MHYPSYRRGKDKNSKGFYRTNMQDREDVIKQIGENFFMSDVYSDYWDYPPPDCFLTIFNSFLELYGMSKEKITFQDIVCYQQSKMIKFNQFEIELIKLMQCWASDEIEKLREE